MTKSVLSDSAPEGEERDREAATGGGRGGGAWGTGGGAWGTGAGLDCVCGSSQARGTPACLTPDGGALPRRGGPARTGPGPRVCMATVFM